MYLHLGEVVDNVNVDGEMSIYRFHLVFVALENAFEHVVDVRLDGSDTCHSFPVGEPGPNFDGGWFKRQLAAEVLETFLERSSWPFYNHDPPVYLNLAVLGDGDRVTRTDLLHGPTGCDLSINKYTKFMSSYKCKVNIGMADDIREALLSKK